MTLDDGTAVEDGKSYRVAGWASVNPQTGKPVSDIVAAYLRSQKTLKIKRLNKRDAERRRQQSRYHRRRLEMKSIFRAALDHQSALDFAR